MNTAGIITWPNIDDGDLNPNQTATQYALTDTNYFTDRTFRIRNTANNETLTIFVNGNSPSSSSSQFSFPDFPSGNFNIGPNSNREFTVRYRPVQGGGRTTTITILSNSGNTGSSERTYTFALRGESREGEISLNYNPAAGNDIVITDGASASTARGTDFGQLRVGGGSVANNSRERQFYVRNLENGPGRLRYSDAVIFGTGASHFQLSGLNDGTLGTGNNDNFTITFNPSSPGVKTATFRLQNSDTNEDPYTFSLRGEGTAFAEITVEGKRDQLLTDFDPVLDGSIVTDSANGTRFDNTTVGETRDSIFSVTNDGDRTLTLSDHAITGPGAGAFRLIGVDSSIPIGDSREFVVRFDPASFGTFNAVVTFNTNDSNENPFNFAIRGSGTAPEIAVSGQAQAGSPFENITDGGGNSPAVVNGTDFGTQDISGGAAQKVFRITNTGNTTLNITDRRFIGDNNGEFSVSNLLSLGNRAIAPGSSHNFTLSFDPSSTGVKNVIFEMGTDDPNEDPFTFDLRGEGIGFPEIRVRGRRRAPLATLTQIEDNDSTPREEDGTKMNDTEVGETFNSLFRIHNDGDGALVINSASISGGDGTFRFVGTPNGTIAPNASRDFDIQFVPSEGEDYRATVSFRTNDSSVPTFNFDIEASGLASEILINGRGVASQFGPILDGDTTPRAPDGTDFLTTAVGADEEYQFRIDNTGNKVLRVTDARFIGDTEDEWSWRQLFPALGARTIQPGESHLFWIRFTPSNVGEEIVTFELRNDDPDEDPYTFRLRAEGVGEPEIQIRGLTGLGIPVDIDNGDLNPDQNVTQFGEVAPFTSSTRNFRVVNGGTDVLRISESSSSNPRYTIGGLASSIAPGEADDFTITFTPNSIGEDQRTTISIVDNAGDPPAPPYTFALTGDGDGPLIEVLGGVGLTTRINDGDLFPDDDDGTIFPGRDPASGSVTNTFIIRNRGTKALNIRGNSVITSGNSPSSAFSFARLYRGNPFVNIGAGQSQQFDIIFDPDTEGLITGLVTLETNLDDGVREQYQFAIQGVGLDPNAAPNIEVRGGTGFSQVISSGDTTPREQDSTDFGTFMATDSPRVTSFQVRNTGIQATLNINNVSVLPANTGFSVIPVADGDLEPAENTTFQVRFDPAAATAGSQVAVIRVTSDDPDTSAYVFNIRAEVEVIDDTPLEFSGISRDGDDLVFDVTAPAGVTYRITSSRTMLEGSWTPVPGLTGLNEGTIRIEDVLNSTNEEPKYFYRLERETR